ncbi:conserved hypothetical protein [Streptomyces himastatinicus ATCC 53653]|uniref:Uncharacterized protein n=1 Tax=Streptomyces himastatinicus ATCC 53653 TaxID=457427 RepID=D9WKJ5_9ACTN|nr:conserved hypothetical protein [Streptomyces himastatinicus ATCC 53653]
MLRRLGYLAVTHAFAALRLLPMSDRDKDAEILALRHQLMVLERQLGKERVRFTPTDRAFPGPVWDHRIRGRREQRRRAAWGGPARTGLAWSAPGADPQARGNRCGSASPMHPPQRHQRTERHTTSYPVRNGDRRHRPL